MELRDIYDLDRIPVGKTAVRGEKIGADEFFMVIHVCIFNSEGEMLIQQRQPFKKGWSNMWDITCGGCSIKGETSRDTVRRELSEELGIDIDFTGVRPNMTVNFDHGFDDFYLVNRDIDISELKLQPEEVQAVKWASMDEIFSMIDNGSFIPFFKSFIHLLFDIRSKPDCLNI